MHVGLTCELPETSTVVTVGWPGFTFGNRRPQPAPPTCAPPTCAPPVDCSSCRPSFWAIMAPPSELVATQPSACSKPISLRVPRPRNVRVGVGDARMQSP